MMTGDLLLNLRVLKTLNNSPLFVSVISSMAEDTTWVNTSVGSRLFFIIAGIPGGRSLECRYSSRYNVPVRRKTYNELGKMEY